MCDLAGVCPTCGRDLAPYETFCGGTIASHLFECACGSVVTISAPVPGLIMTRQDAVYKP